jgi:hypothetical protein
MKYYFTFSNEEVQIYILEQTNYFTFIYWNIIVLARAEMVERAEETAGGAVMEGAVARVEEKAGGASAG